MLTAEEVRALIVCRLYAAYESCNAHHITHCEGQIRGLVSVLLGEPPPDFAGSVARVCEIAGIPYDGLAIAEPWLVEHGFQIREGKPVHPRFSRSW